MENVLALIVATAVLVAIPGPNVAQCRQRGFRYGLITVAATTFGVGLQLKLLTGGFLVGTGPGLALARHDG